MECGGDGMDWASQVDIVNNANRGEGEAMSGGEEDRLEGKAEEESAENASLPGTTLRGESCCKSAVLNYRKRGGSAVTPVGQPEEDVELRVNVELLEHGVSMEGVKAIFKVNLQDYVIRMSFKVGLEGVDSELDASLNSHTKLDGLEDVGECVIREKAQKIESG